MTICDDGKYEKSAGAYTEEFEIDCDKTILEGPISKEEAAEIEI